MAKYFFDVHQEDGRVDDDTIGGEFADDDAALEEAGLALAEMARDVAMHMRSAAVRIIVRNQFGQVVGYRSAHFEGVDLRTGNQEKGN